MLITEYQEYELLLSNALKKSKAPEKIKKFILKFAMRAFQDGIEFQRDKQLRVKWDG